MKQRKVAAKANKIPKRKTKKAEQSKLSIAVSWAQIWTPAVLLLTLGAAIYAGVTAYKEYSVVYDQSQAVYNDYQARTRPYLVIQNLQFYETNNDFVYLLIDVTNSGERPATNISIEHLEVCVIPENQCMVLNWSIEGGDKDTIAYPGRINTTRIKIDKNDYLLIKPTDEIMVYMKYSFGHEGDKEYKEYLYEAGLRLRPDNIWHVESESGD
jgi:hypothetical protein